MGLLDILRQHARAKRNANVITQDQQCSTCGKIETYHYGTLWACKCSGKIMTPIGEPNFPTGNIKERRLHMVRIWPNQISTYVAPMPSISWQFPDPPKAIFEVWQLRPGRMNGERLGHLAERESALGSVWEWKTPDGVAIQSGIAATPANAVNCMMVALDGGVHAARIIAEIVS